MSAQVKHHKSIKITDLVIPFMVSAYAIDLQKFAINLASAVLYKPLAWSETAHLVDIGLAAALVLLGALKAGKLVRIPSLWKTPLLIQFLFFVCFTMALIVHFDLLSRSQYLRFVAGNLLLFILPLLFLRKEFQIELFFNVLLFTAVVYALLGGWYLHEGLMWSSSRTKFIPNTGIRMGFICALAFLYVIIAGGRWKFSTKLLISGILLLGIIASGSKGSLIILAVTLAFRAGVYFLMGRRMKKAELYLLISFLLLAAPLMYMLSVSEGTGFAKQVTESDTYLNSLVMRIDIIKYYIQFGLQEPLLGHGISAAYSEVSGYPIRTHSAISSIFVQAGIIPVLLHLSFALWFIFVGMKHVSSRVKYSPQFRLILEAAYFGFFLLLLKSEITSDIPGNRELWFFAGLLLSCFALARKRLPESEQLTDSSINTAPLSDLAAPQSPRA